MSDQDFVDGVEKKINHNTQSGMALECGVFAIALGCGGAVALVTLILQIIMLVYVYKDAQARGVEPLLWTAIVFFTHLIGFIVWMCVRPPLLKT